MSVDTFSAFCRVWSHFLPTGRRISAPKHVRQKELAITMCGILIYTLLRTPRLLLGRAQMTGQHNSWQSVESHELLHCVISFLPRCFPVNFQFSLEFICGEFVANWWEVALGHTHGPLEGICCIGTRSCRTGGDQERVSLTVLCWRWTCLL